MLFFFYIIFDLLVLNNVTVNMLGRLPSILWDPTLNERHPFKKTFFLFGSKFARD